MSGKKIVSLVVLEDLTSQSKCDEGFMRIKRFRIANRYADQSCSEGYRCDVVYREAVDAVAVVLYWMTDGGQIMVVLRQCLRPPLFFRPIIFPESETSDSAFFIYEIPAGVIEVGEITPLAIAQRAEQEVWEETGIRLDPGRLIDLGSPVLTSPGFCIERVLIKTAQIDSNDWNGRCLEHPGDGSLMEEGGKILSLPLEEAIRLCQEGNFSDGKTELALFRLSDYLNLH